MTNTKSPDASTILKELLIDVVTEVGDCAVSFNDENTLWKEIVVHTDDNWQIEFRVKAAQVEVLLWDLIYPPDQSICDTRGYSESPLEYQTSIDLHNPESRKEITSIVRDKCEKYWDCRRGCMVVWWEGDGREDKHTGCDHAYDKCHYDHSECYECEKI